MNAKKPSRKSLKKTAATKLAGTLNLETVPDFFLVAHSHGVSLLDGITDWRNEILISGENDPRYGDAFQGWFNGSITSEPFAANVTNTKLLSKKIEAWLISSASGVGSLAHLNSSDGTGVLCINPKFSELLSSWSGSSPIVSMLNGNEYATTMLNWLPAYDFLDPEITAIEAGVPIIDEMFIDQRINNWINKLYWSLVAIKKLVGNPLIHILPPPPRQNPQLSQHLEVIRDAVVAHGFLSDQLRLKWYRRYCRHLTSCLMSFGCQVLAPPPEACTSYGLLKEEYAEGLTHGNSKYGALVAEQLTSLLVTTL